MSSTSPPPSRWMEHLWEEIKDRPLCDVTLPGAHNAGCHDLRADLKCTSDDYYASYLAHSEYRGIRKSAMSQEEFDQAFLPWQLNHLRNFDGLLRSNGARFFHLKIGNFNKPEAERMDLHQIFFQHRGFTSRETVADMISTFRTFLAENPAEFLVLGFNNLHNCHSKTFSRAEISALSNELVNSFGGGSTLISEPELFSSTLATLKAQGKRVAIFMKGDPDDVNMTPGVIPSATALTENWDAVMDSGALESAKDWLRRDIRENAVVFKRRYYVVQANPNNGVSEMFESMDSGQKPSSLRAFLNVFLTGLKEFVHSAAENVNHPRISAVSTDFLEDSKPLELAISLITKSK